VNISKYVVVNRTKNVLLADTAERADSILGRMKGLIGRTAEDFTNGKALWLIPSEGIHTFGMNFPIDAAYLDSHGRILKLYHGLVPNRIAGVMLKAQSVLELPPGMLARTNTLVGDILEFQLVKTKPDTEGKP